MQSKFYPAFLFIFIFFHPQISQAQWESVPGYGPGNLLQLETAGPGQLYGLFQGGGLFRSDNYGLSWTRLQTSGPTPLTVQSFAITPGNSIFIVANGGIWRGFSRNQAEGVRSLQARHRGRCKWSPACPHGTGGHFQIRRMEQVKRNEQESRHTGLYRTCRVHNITMPIPAP